MRPIILPSLLAFALFIAGALTPDLAAQEATPTAEDPAAVAAAFGQAVQAGDVDAIVALFAPDAVQITPFGTFRGPEEIRAFEMGFFQGSPGLTVTLGEPTVVLNTAVSRDLFASDPMRAAGTERIAIVHTLVVANGQIVALIAVPDPDDPVTMAFFAAMQAAAATPTVGTPAP
jgi:ketosteroid isomerase-like protein